MVIQPFIYTRTIRFQDTDAAGVVYFANILAMCHEAYEESLAATNINIKTFFSRSAIAFPIVHTSIDFFRPLFCGDLLLIHLLPQSIDNHTFEIAYELKVTEKSVAKAVTRHVCIDTNSRKKQELSTDIHQWLQQWS